MSKSLFASRATRKIIAVLIAAVILLSVIPAMNVSALNGTSTFKPAESNIAEKYWVSASASSNSGDAAGALDKDAATVWQADEADSAKWFQIDLGGTYNAVRKTEVEFINSIGTYKYKLEGSADGSAWILLADRRDNTRRAGGFTDLFRLEGLRYLKLTFNSSEDIGIKKFRVINYLRDDMDNGSDTSAMSSGTMYYNSNNNPSAPNGIRGGVMNEESVSTGNNFFGLTKDMGWDTIRLRIWNEPKNEGNGNASTGPNNCSPASTMNVARYIKGAGQRLAIDFHYADSWSDPQNQPKPYAWANLPFEEADPATNDLIKTTYQFTYDTIKGLIDQGTAPSIIAIGNEITNGMMWGREYELANPYHDKHHYYNTYIANNPNAPYGGGVEWVNYDAAGGDKTSAEYLAFLASVERLAKLVDAGQRAIQKLNEEFELDMETEMHFAFNVFEGNPKSLHDPEKVFEKVVALVGGLNDELSERSGMTDRIGVSYYADWHGTYDILQKNIVELSKMLPAVKFNIAECSPPRNGTITTEGSWMSDPNVVQNELNGFDPSLPTSFRRSDKSQGDMTVDLMKLINDVPNNIGQGVWPWNGQSVYFTGGQPYSSFLAFSQAFATNAVESSVYVVTESGTAPELPATVKNIDAATGAVTDAPVVWSAVSEASYASAGTFEVTGTVTTDGNMKETKAIVTVTDVPRDPVTDYSIKFTTTDGVSTAVFTVDNTYGDTAGSGIGIIAVYDENGKLADARFTEPVSADIGELNIGQLQISEQPENYTVKAFFWDAASWAPLCSPQQPVYQKFVPVIEDAANIPDGYYYQNQNAPITLRPIPELEGREDDFICGADLSSLWVVADRGAKFTDLSGQALIEGDEISNCLAIMKKYGLNWVRLRLWNDITPFAPGITDGQGQGGLNSLENTLTIAKKAHALGLKVLLDYHYSDTWCDPGRQTKPRAWTNLTLPELEQALYDFTKTTLEEFVAEGCMPEMVQIGNENNSGLLYDEINEAQTGWTSAPAARSGNVNANGGANYILLTKAGIRAVREVDPNNDNPETRTKIMIHLANGNNTNMFTTRANLLRNNDVDYDVMGASYYPFWHGTIAQITNTLNTIANNYGKEVAIAETGWEHMSNVYRPAENSGGPRLSRQISNAERNTHPEWDTSPQGQADALWEISNAVANVPNNRGIGVFVWEPAWISTPQMGSGWAAGTSNIVVSNQAHFDSYGRALPSVNVWPRLFPAYNQGGGEAVITSIDPVTATTTAGVAPNLPANVTVRYSDSSSRSLPVVWDSIAESQYAAPGSFTVQGTVDGTTIKASCAVTVGEAAGPNLLGNPSFDVTGTWTFGANNHGNRGTGSGNAHTGTGYLNYWRAGGTASVTDANATGPYQTLTLEAGVYNFSVFVQSDKPGSQGTLGFYIQQGTDTGTRVVSSIVTGDEGDLINNGYQNHIKFTREITVPTAGEWRVGFYNDRCGDEVWITLDDAELAFARALS